MIEYFSRYNIEAKTVTEDVAFPCVRLDQVHGNRVIVVDCSTSPFLKADGMVTKEKNLPLLIRHADCQVAIFYDPIAHVLGITHAGWRGQVQLIYTEMVKVLKNKFKTDPENLLVAFAPSLGPNRSEFKNYKTELAEWMWEFEEEPFHFNLWKIAEAELMLCGIKRENIELPSICTYLDERFHSFRRNKTDQRNYTVARLL